MATTIISAPFLHHLALIERSGVVVRPGADSSKTVVAQPETVEHRRELERRVRELSSQLDLGVA